MTEPNGGNEFRVIGLRGIPIVQPDDDIAELIVSAATEQGVGIEDGDVIAVTQRIVSRAEHRLRRLDEFEPSPFALEFADRTPASWRRYCANRRGSSARLAAC